MQLRVKTIDGEPIINGRPGWEVLKPILASKPFARIDIDRADKSDNQRGYYFGHIVEEYMDYSYYTKDEADYLLRKYASPSIFCKEVNGEPYIMGVSGCTVDEMKEHIRNCITYLRRNCEGINIREPE